jgi:hypothetical protein
LRSTDGGMVWTELPSSGSMVGGIAGDGDTIFKSDFSVCEKWGDGHGALWATAPEEPAMIWSPMDEPYEIEIGANQLTVDHDNHILYSSACRSGFWRYRIE